MDSKISLKDYLKFSRSKRKRLISVANEYFQKVLNEETRRNRAQSRENIGSRENFSVLKKNRVILEPIKEKVSSFSTLRTRNAGML
jgi:hypothetical protein